MLKLQNITKDYKSGDTTVQALKGIDLQFRENEFVSILGQSGCGKTTLLNIIGGLDRYTTGDLFINGKSTKLYKDSDWDNYRNHTIGFIFQRRACAYPFGYFKIRTQKARQRSARKGGARRPA